MAIDWTPARLEVDLNYKSKDIILASEWNNLWKETRLQGNNNTDGIVLLIETVEGNVTHLTNLDNLFADLESKVTAHTGNSDIHVTSIQKTAWTAKYDKPSGGIPKSDLASTVQTSLEKADSALQQHQDISVLTAHVANSNIHVTTTQKTAWSAKYDKPSSGIPKTDLSSAVQTSLGKADTALQQHQDISGKADVTALNTHTGDTTIHTSTAEKNTWNAKYTKPSTGIPKTDLASSVQTSLGKADTALQEHQDISGKADVSALTAHTGDTTIHTNATEKAAWNAKYDKPSSGIPKTDLASAVQTSLGKADSALQEHQDISGKANKPAFSQYTILTSGWSSGVYSFESDFPNATYDIEIELDSTATESQVEAWSNAKVTAVFGTNTMKALGDVPTVDIPVIVKKVIK